MAAITISWEKYVDQHIDIKGEMSMIILTLKIKHESYS